MEDKMIDLTVHIHDWKVFNGMCICMGRCSIHPYGMFDGCEEGHKEGEDTL